MLNIELDPQTAAYLAEILQQENTTPDELIQGLIRQHWLGLPNRTLANRTLVERRGGHPEHLLQTAPPDLSEREARKQAIAQHLSQRQARRTSQ
jgi:hypothetical protein